MLPLEKPTIACIGDKKVPKRDDESGGTGVKGVPLWGWGQPDLFQALSELSYGRE